MKSKHSALIPTLAAMGGNTIFGFSFMFSRLALNVAAPFVMLMYRFLLAFLLVGVIALWARRAGRTDWLRFDLKWKDVFALVPFGLVQPVAYFLCESYGVSLTNATVSGVIIALVPIVALGAGALFLKEMPTLRQVLFALLSIAGVTIMTLQQSAGGGIQPLGILLLIGAVVTGTGFNILSRKLSDRYSALERTFVMMLVACVAFTGLACATATPAELVAPLSSPTFLGAMAYLSVLSSIAAFLLLNFASGRLPVGKITAFCNLTTVLSVFAGVVFLGESFTWVTLGAAAVIIVGVWGVQKG